jgi:Protein of unknown function (DUF3761)
MPSIGPLLPSTRRGRITLAVGGAVFALAIGGVAVGHQTDNTPRAPASVVSTPLLPVPSAPVSSSPAAAVRSTTAVGAPIAPVAPPAACGENEYTNVDGSCVSRPEQAPSAPAGATAKCDDGTWSFSQHHSGSCSRHGGVAYFLN